MDPVGWAFCILISVILFCGSWIYDNYQLETVLYEGITGTLRSGDCSDRRLILNREHICLDLEYTYHGMLMYTAHAGSRTKSQIVLPEADRIQI